MFNLWSLLNSSLVDQKGLEEKLKGYKDVFKSSLGDYYQARDPKSSQTKKDNPKLKANENELIRKISSCIDLDEARCCQIYLEYLSSAFNQFIISSDLSEKLNVDELFSAHFNRFVDYYHRERVSFLKTLILIVSNLAENRPLKNGEPLLSHIHTEAVRRVFSPSDLKPVFKSAIKDYTTLCKDIKLQSTRSQADFANSDSYQLKTSIELRKELELTLELLLVLTSLTQLEHVTLQELIKEINKQLIVKHITNNVIQSVDGMQNAEQIAYLHAFVVVSSIKVDRLITDIEQKTITQDEKAKFLSVDFKNIMNELITSFGSNQRASPVILTWSTLLYNLSIDADVAKLFTPELKSLINKMFSLAAKENTFFYILNMFASNIFSNQEVLWHIKQSIYHLMSSVLHSFDESSMSQHLKALYELTFFCMNDNEQLCREFWTTCQRAERDNLTILMSYAMDTFPISFGLSLTFFSLLAQVDAPTCQQIMDHLSHMDQFCEYFDNLMPQDYESNGDNVKLLVDKKLFDAYNLHKGQKGSIIGASSETSQNQNSIHRLILQYPAVCWNVEFNCFDLIQNYLNRINYLVAQNNLGDESHIVPIVQLIDSIFKHVFELDQTCQDYDIYIKYMENFANSCFLLFTNLMNNESPNSYRLLTKLLELFNSISPSVYDKLVALLHKNSLIGHSSNYDTMNLQQLFQHRFHIVNNAHKQLFIFKSNDLELITAYLKLINSLITETGSGIEYMSVLCCVLVLIFPQVHVWKTNTLVLNEDLSTACLSLLHNVLNTSSQVVQFQQTQSFYLTGMGKINVNNNLTIDQFCEAFLLNTECSESLLNLIYVAFECSQDTNFFNDIKKLDSVIMQSISLINRLLFVSSSDKSAEEESKEQTVRSSNLYSLLIKSIKQPTNQTTGNNSSSLFVNSSVNAKSEDNLMNEIINKNNQFLLQLNLMMSQSSANLGKILDSSSASFNPSRNDLNWFYQLTKIVVYKPNPISDCLLFSIFNKIAKLTPRLFGSLIGPYSDQVHKVVLGKLKLSSDGQTLSTVSEFICSLIEHQPGFFQKLADLKVEPIVQTSSNDLEQFGERFIEGEQSILKAIFKLLNDFRNQDRQSNQDYYISLAGILSIFNTIWSNKKLDYMNYCKQKNEFWSVMASVLKIIKKNTDQEETRRSNLVLDSFAVDNQTLDDNTIEYLDYFDFDNQLYENEFSRFDEFILEANVKSVSYAFTIFAIELFEIVYLKKKTPAQKEIQSFLVDTVFGKNLIEKWLDFYTFQLKRDLKELAEEAKLIEDQTHNTTMSTADVTLISTRFSMAQSKLSSQAQKKSKAKTLVESIKTLLLLINRTSLIFKAKPELDSKSSQLIEHISINKVNMKPVFAYLVESMFDMITYFLYLNNMLVRFQQEQQSMATDNNSFEPMNTNTGQKPLNYFTLKQSNEIFKLFHSMSNMLMILVTSLKENTNADLRQLTNNLVIMLEKLVLDDLNYFPAIINNTQISILHLLTQHSPQELIDDSMWKRFVSSLCKIFINSDGYLENQDNLTQKGAKESILTLVLNVNLFKTIMNKMDSSYWVNELNESCAIHSLYTLFEKYIQSKDNKDLIYSVLEMFYAMSQSRIQLLEKTDFNARTCLLVLKLFNYSFDSSGSPPCPSSSTPSLSVETNVPIKWSNILCIYLNIQTNLLTRLKYNYLKEAILFFGSYFETFVQVNFALQQSINLDLLQVIRAVCRFMSEISKYKKELYINMANSVENMERMFCSLIQLAIMKLKMFTITKTQQHQQQSISALSRLTSEEIVSSQSLLFSIINYCLDALSNYTPDFADGSYLNRLDEYKMLLSFQLAPPSSFDYQSPLSFGSILWLIDHTLKIVHRHDQAGSNQSGSTKPTVGKSKMLEEKTNLNESVNLSPKKATTTTTWSDEYSEVKLPSKSLVVPILEKTLNFLLAQIVLCDRFMPVSSRDKKLFKRELNSEINSIIQGLTKTFKKANTTQHLTKSPTSNASSASLQAASSILSTSSKQTYDFFKCIQISLQQTIE